ncbi:MAG: hypothetical protein J6T51_01160 [Kiritimatiellae bacterium]|nr:hypothetical protein [Kiritimatiellia bacterium]
MKRMTAVLLVLTFVGCTRIPSEVEAKIDAIARSTGHPWKQWVAGVDALLADVKELQDERLRVVCLLHFSDRMTEVDLLDPNIRSLQTAADEMIHECVYRIPDSMCYLSGASMEDVWDVRLKMFDWMRRQATRLYGDGKLPKGLTRHEDGGLVIIDQSAYRRWSDRRNAYRKLTSAYNERLNYAEKRFPNPSDGKIDEDRIPELKKKIEKFLGRPMRTREQCDEDWYSNKHEFPRW